jgi:hypothetical protein
MIYNSNKNFLINPQCSLKDSIKIIEHGLDPDLCDLIVAEYCSESCSFSSSKVYAKDGVKENSEVRNSQYIQISDSQIINRNSLIRSEIDNSIFCSITNIVGDYIQCNSPFLSLSQDSGYELIVYSKGSFFNEHTDQLTFSPNSFFDRGSCRQLSVVAQLR